MLPGATLAVVKRIVRSRYFWYAMAFLTVVALIRMYGLSQYNRGYSEREAEYQQSLEQERRRVEAANQAALSSAREEIQRLRETARVRDAHIQRILREAEQDLTAGTGALSVDSVRRLNSVR